MGSGSLAVVPPKDSSKAFRFEVVVEGVVEDTSGACVVEESS